MPVAVSVPTFLPPQAATVLGPSTRTPLASAQPNGSATAELGRPSVKNAREFASYRARFYPSGYDPVKAKRTKKRHFGLSDIPTFYPTKDEFENPLDYIAKIRSVGEKFGAVKIVPPRSWKPEFSLPVEKFRFATRLQRLNHMNGRTRAAVSYLDALGTFHSQTGRQLSKLPNVNGRTVDMWRLKTAVEAFGGYDEVCDSKEWLSMARAIDVGDFPPSSAQNIAYAIKKAYEAWILPYEASLGRGRTLDEYGRPAVLRHLSQSDAASPSGRRTRTSKRAISNSDDENDDDEDREVDAIPTKSNIIKSENGTGDARGESPPFGDTGDNKRKRNDVADVQMADGEGDGDVKRRKLDEEIRIPTTIPFNVPTGDVKNLCQVCFRGIVVPGPPIVKCDGCELSYHVNCLLIRPHRGIEEWWCPKCLDLSGEDFGFDEGGTYNLWEFKDKCDKWKRAYFGLKEPQKGAWEGGGWSDTPAEHAKGRDGVAEEDVEAEFWNLVEDPYNGVEVEYGADLHTSVYGSGFGKNNPPHPFHLTNLPFQHPSLFTHLSRNIPGMMVPWIYVGSVFSTFCWHVEDHWSYAINYNWLGETKTWYIVPQRGAEKFEAVMRETVPELFEKTPDLLFHITTMLSPGLLQEKGVPVFAADQRPGEFIVTWPRAYHSGFNHGFNIAEAVNFATPDWLAMGNRCVERYRECNRAPVFSHDEMVVRVARGLKGVGKDGKTMQVQEEAPIDARTVEWLLPALTDLHRRETDARFRLRKMFPNLTTVAIEGGTVPTSQAGPHNRNVSAVSNSSGDVVLVPGGTTVFRPDDDEIECGGCKAYCFLSAVRCGNSNCDRKYDDREDAEDEDGQMSKMGKMGPISKTGSTKKKGMKVVAGGAARVEMTKREDAMDVGASASANGEHPEFKQDIRYGFDHSKTKRSLRYVCLSCVDKLCPCTPVNPVLCVRVSDEELTTLLSKYQL